jgi:CHAT domain-containing protein/tetratricopeptide (TPR) repeat protein
MYKFSNAQSPRFRLVILLGCLCLILSLSPKLPRTLAQSGDEAEIRGVVERFLAALQKKDMETLKALWSEKAQDGAGTKPNSPPAFEGIGGVDVSSLSINRIGLSAVEATAWVSVKVVAGDPKTARSDAAPGLANLTIHLAKEAGAWKIAQYGSSEEELAGEIALAKTDEEREALIEQNKHLVTVQLDKALLTMGQRLVSQGGYARALELYEITGKIAEQIKDTLGIADLSRCIGNIGLLQGRYPEALARYQESLGLYEQIGNKDGIARVLNNIGLIHRIQGNNAEALEFYKKSLDVDTEIGNKEGISRAFGNIAVLQSAEGSYALALESFEKSLRISEEIGDKQTIATTLLAIGELHYRQADYIEALSYYQKSLKISEDLGISAKIADALHSIGLVMGNQGDYSGAVEQFQKSLRISEMLGDKANIAAALNNIAVQRKRQGNYSQALQYYERALRIDEELGRKSDVAGILINVGALLETEGSYAQALKYFERSMTLAGEAGDRGDVGEVLLDIAQLQREQGNFTDARESYQKGLKVAEEIGNKRSISDAIDGLGATELATANYASALAYLQRSLSGREEVGDKEGIAQTLGHIGEVYTSRGSYAEAVESEERAAALARQIRAPETLVRALATAAKAYRATGKPDQARRALVEAITTVEEMRGLITGSEEERQGFLEREIAPYYAMAGLLIGQDSPLDAFAFAEQAKARALIDVLGSGRANLSKGLTAEEKDKEQGVHSRLVSLNAQIVKEKVRKDPDEKRVSDLTTQLEKARLEYDDFRTSLYAAHPELKIQRAEFQPISLAECGGLLPDLHSALLEFAVSDDQTYLFVLSKKNSSQGVPDLTVHKIDIKSKELTDLCNQFRGQLAQKGLGFHPLATKLYALLLGPAAAELKGKTNLVIVPDGALWDLPFQALQPTRDRYLIEDLAVSYAPSLTALREMSKRAHPSSAPSSGGVGLTTTLLAFGNPALGAETSSEIKEVFMDADLAPLPQAESQVHQLGRLYGSAQSKIYTGAEATEDRLKAEAPNARILHIAAHGIVNNASPLYSQLVLARGQGSEDDGLLEAWEVMNMDLKADLVVLAACDTARGRYGAGEGMIGLSWAFFVAGCPTTVVSQWSVEAESTSQLMVEFHRNLRSWLTKAEALRRAELKMLKGDIRYRRPYYWAPFVVIGTAN